MTPEAIRLLDTAEKRWPHTFYAVSGDSFLAWERFHKRAGTWLQCHGWLVTIGHVVIGKTRTRELERMPVCVSVTWDIVGGKLIAFYEATSQVVDHRMVDKYIRKNCPNHTDVTNFHIAMQDIEDAAGQFTSEERGGK